MRLFHRHKVLRPILLTAAVLLLSGCMKVGPDYVRPRSSVSPSWPAASDDRVKTEPAEYREWWKAFNDPVLDRIVDQAYRENLTLKIAGVRVLEARAQLGIAVGNLYPQTQQASGSLLYNRTSERSSVAAAAQGGGGTGGQSDDKVKPRQTNQSNIQLGFSQDQVGVNAAWEIDFWGKFRRAIESADAALLAAIADYDSALVSLTADAANSYVQIRTVGKRLEIALQNVETQKQSLQIAEARYQGGVTSELDVQQAQTALFNTQATVPLLKAQLTQAKNALSTLLGLPPGKIDDLLDGAMDIPAPPPQVAVGIPADLLRRRPDVRSAELQAASQSALIGVAKADLLPAFSLTGSFGFLSTDIGKFSLSDIGDWRARTAAAGPSFQWNILNYGRITSNVRVQDARFQELLISYQNTVLKAQQEVEDSLAGFLRAQENAEYLARSARSAKSAYDLALIQYQQGIADFTTVLTSQLSLLASQESLANALGSISANLVGVYRALGGGWQIREGRDVVSPETIEAMSKRTNWGKLLDTAVYVPPASGPGTEVRLPDW